jgi:hypothetical protein
MQLAATCSTLYLIDGEIKHLLPTSNPMSRQHTWRGKTQEE